MKRSEILANRQKWIDFLLLPTTKKLKEHLDNGNGERCCLGHGCYALNIESNVVEDGEFGEVIAYGKKKDALSAPIELVELVGFHNTGGVCMGENGMEVFAIPFKDDLFPLLETFNDNTDATPQEIGQYLQSVISGGPNTPFRALSEYEE